MRNSLRHTTYSGVDNTLFHPDIQTCFLHAVQVLTMGMAGFIQTQSHLPNKSCIKKLYYDT